MKKYLLMGGAVVLTVAILLLIVVQNLNSWAEKKLKEQVAAKSKGLYSLQVGQVEISLLAGSVTLDSLKLIPTTSLWKQMQKKSPAQAPASLSEVTAARVQVRGVPLMKLLFGGDFGIKALHIDQPEWILRQMKKDTTSQPLHQKIGEQFRSMAIKQIEVENGTFRLRKKDSQQSDVFSATRVKVQAKGVQIDSASYQDASRAFYSKELTISLKEAKFFLSDGNYQIRSGSVFLSTEQREISFSTLRLVPLRSAQQMAKKAGEAVTRLKMEVPVLKMRQVDFAAFSKHANVHIGSVFIHKPQVDAYKDGKHFSPKGEGLLPHDFIRKLPFGLNIRKVHVTDMYVFYRELSEKALKTGYVTGGNINLKLTNLTNDKNFISRKKPAVLKVSGYLMGKVFMQATIRLALLNANGYHALEGTIGKGAPAILNPIIEPSMLVSVKSGFLQQGTFRVELTKTAAKGFMQLQYHDFKIELLSKDKEKKQSFGKKIKSFVANQLVLKSESEENGQAPRTGTIDVQRRKERSFLTYWKDCLANGVLSVIGAPI